MVEFSLTDAAEQLQAPNRKRKPPAKKAWTPPGPHQQNIRLFDFHPLYGIPDATAYRLAIRGIFPYMRVPGTKVMLFPRAKVERIIASWESNGRPLQCGDS